MKGYIALCLVIILLMRLTESQKIDEKAAQKILENYSKNPTSSSNSDLEKAYRANCCDAPNNRGTGGKKIYLFMLHFKVLYQRYLKFFWCEEFLKNDPNLLLIYSAGLLRRQKRAGPICRWIRRVIAEVR